LAALIFTGDQDLGISPGSPTWTWLNRFDKQFSRYTPSIELGLTNSISGDRRYQRSFTTLGNAATFRGGLAIDLWKFTSVEFSGYSVQGLGSQKVYSRKVAAGATSSTSSQMGRRPFDTQHLTSGNAALADDHGFNASFYVSPMPRLEIGISYNRSTSFELNTVSASIGFRFGHMQNASNRK
jgi:hypothetical protein